MVFYFWSALSLQSIMPVMSRDTNYGKRFDKIDGQLDKIVATMLKRFDKIDKALEKKADKVDTERLLGLADSLAKRQETCDQERLVMGHQLTRHDRWAHEMAGKIGHQLTD